MAFLVGGLVVGEVVEHTHADKKDSVLPMLSIKISSMKHFDRL